MKKEELSLLNEQAREMKRNGDFEGVRKLCKEKGIAEQMVDDFILGEVLQLDDTKTVNTENVVTEDVNVEVIVPFYRSIEEKLEAESEELLKNVKEDREREVIKAQLKPIIDYILSDDDLKAKAFRNWKELNRCYKHMTDKAKQFAIQGVACIGDATVFGWIREYYDLDDQQEVTAERLKKAIAEKKATEVKANTKATHAVINMADEFTELAMLIIDEQHKFGVEQREALTKKCKDNVQHTDIIGAISETCMLFTLSTADEINYKEGANYAELEIKGIGTAGKTVGIYVDGVSVAETKTSPLGYYSAKVNLENPENYKDYIIKVVSKDVKGKNVEVTKEVRTIKNAPVLKEALLYIEAHEYKNGYEIFDLMNIEGIKYVTFQPSKPYKFIIRYENNKNIEKVLVSSERGGILEKLEAVWNEDEQAYVTMGYFDNNPQYVPGSITIEYIDKAPEIPSVDEESGTLNISDEVMANIPAQWNDAECVVVEGAESDFEAEINLKTGDQLIYSYDGFTYEEFAEELIRIYGLENEENTILPASTFSLNSTNTKHVNRSAENVSEGVDKCLQDINNLIDVSDCINEVEMVSRIVNLINTHGGTKISKYAYQFSKLLEYVGFTSYFDEESSYSNPYAMNLDIGVEDIISYTYNPNDIENAFMRTAVGFGKTYVSKNICDSIGISLGVVNCAKGNLLGTAEFGGTMFNLGMAKMNVFLDTSLTTAQRDAKCAQLQMMAQIEFQKLMHTFVGNALTASSIMLAGTGIGLALGMAAVLHSLVIGPMIESGTFLGVMNGKESLIDAILKWIIDPSGYVYEGVTSNRLSEVTMTLYYKASLEDKEAVLWDASEYNQINPIITDSMGTYAWDVPEGYWQVKAEKEGYETTYSEWMEVPPIQTDVNLKMSKIDAPKVSSASIYETYTIVEFDQYVVPETVNNLILKDEKGNLIETTITYDTSQKDWDGNVYAKVFKLEHTATVVSEGTNITLEVSEGIIGSSGKAVEAESIKEVAETHIVVDGGDNLYLVEEDSIDVVFTVSDLFVNNAVVTVEDSSIIRVSDVINNEGIYTVTVTGLSKGETTLTITLEELGIQKEVAVTVDSNIALTESVYIHGFQISSTVCGLRTIYSIEEAINGLEVVDRGILYSLADLTPEEELYVGSSHQYVASYSATEAGIISHKFSDSDTATSYAMTMSFGTSTVNLFTAKWRVRAYAQLADGSYVYSEAEEYTVYAVADALYQRRMMSNYPSHNYLYTDILTVVNPDYIKIDYDWNDSVIKF